VQNAQSVKHNADVAHYLKAKQCKKYKNQEDSTLKCGVPVNLLSVEESRWDSTAASLEVSTSVLNHSALSAKAAR
jgi:hypothetical protein